jgi:hypothetical protein
MQLIIKPADNSMLLLLETAQYKSIWAQYSRQIFKAFREVTGLEFQQWSITALVSAVEQSSAGHFHESMRLSADGRLVENKLITVVHELSHRLLGGNAIGAERLNQFSEAELYGAPYDEAEHSNIYLFEYDVIRTALGEDWGNRCIRWEARAEETDAHDKAWNRVMRMSYAERQTALKILAAKAVTRERWDELE